MVKEKIDNWFFILPSEQELVLDRKLLFGKPLFCHLEILWSYIFIVLLRTEIWDLISYFL